MLAGSQMPDVPTHASEHPTKVQAAEAEEVAYWSGPKKKVKTPKAPWNVVWCHEHCHKGGMESLRQALQDAVQDVGAAFVCMKKSNRYMNWLEDNHSRPHLIITNWREVKPTLQDLAEAGGCRRPIGIVVLAESDVVYRRAYGWMKSVSEVRIAVLLETAMEPLKALLASFKEEVFQDEIQMPQAPLPIAQPLPQESQAGGGAKQMQQTSQDSLPMPTCDPPSVDKLSDPDKKKQSLSAGARPFVPWRHPGIDPGSLLAILTEAVKHQQTACRIQQDLQNLPEVYED
eukprot:TRINITY_DN6279_c0_g1_i2.p1 TRINITY_DN6279_c0_g1~~TRINITY_DN6279_c0_g1_i2.p1  ORF type:complete len:287 (+),score=59.91 TRINITY_DN6279_c0_g1_i2:52-912(+)